MTGLGPFRDCGDMVLRWIAANGGRAREIPPAEAAEGDVLAFCDSSSEERTCFAVVVAPGRIAVFHPDWGVHMMYASQPIRDGLSLIAAARPEMARG